MNIEQPVNLNEQPMSSSSDSQSGNRYTALFAVLNQISGVLLFASIPVVLWLYSLSLKSVYSFTYTRFFMLHTLTGKCLRGILVVALLYHVIMGMRYTLMQTKISQQFGDVNMTFVISIGTLLLTGLFFYF